VIEPPDLVRGAQPPLRTPAFGLRVGEASFEPSVDGLPVDLDGARQVLK